MFKSTGKIGGTCALIAALALSAALHGHASDDIAAMRSQMEQMHAEMDTLRSQSYHPDDVIKSVDASYNTRCTKCWDDGGNPVTTRSGHLVIGGLIQVWYHQINKDSKGWEDGPAVLGSSPAPFGSNSTQDNDTFRVRRAYLTFDYCVTENISGHMKIDPAASALGFPKAPSNQAPFFNAGFDTSLNGPDTGTFGARSGHRAAGCPANGNGADTTLCNAGIGNPNNGIVQRGGSNANALLQEAYINYHDICFAPCHDVSIGQMRRKLGEEGVRNDGELDFAERSMITQVADDYDLGIQVHGSWFSDRLQYWVGAFDGAGTAFQTRSNRPDDNSRKDLLASLMVRPVWENNFWGSLELGYSGLWGTGGDSGSNDPVGAPSNGLNRRTTAHGNQYAWLYYAPGDALRGLWTRGEFGKYKDRFAPGEVATGLFNFTNDPAPFNIYGYYGAVGYKFGESAFSDNLPCWMRNFELAYRFEAMQNLFYQSLVNPNRQLDVFQTRVHTAGLNYYIKGHYAKIQVDYNFVSSQHGHSNGDRQIRDVNNNNLIVNFQVAF